MARDRLAIEVRGVSKGFRIPTRRVDTLRDRLVGRQQPAYETLQVLEDISFEIEQGEFFGIVGRNGSGKSTLLKLIAGIYRPDSGTIRAAGRLAPIIELGVGFNSDLSALENVVMNATIMGLDPVEARSRYPEIMKFAELGEFEHVQLKNYSSGMRMRLGFSIMTHVDADLFLFDEVLAVGDGNFQEKCGITFAMLEQAGRTGILVTHSMVALRAYCERAMLLEDGRVHTIGSVEEVAEEYENLPSLTEIAEEEGEPERVTVSEPA